MDGALAIQTDYSTPAATLGCRAHSHCEALSLAAFLVDKVWRSHSSYCTLGLPLEMETNRDDCFEPCAYMESSALHAHFRGIITVLLRKSCGSAKAQTFRRHSEGASARNQGTLRTSYTLQS